MRTQSDAWVGGFACWTLRLPPWRGQYAARSMAGIMSLEGSRFESSHCYLLTTGHQTERPPSRGFCFLVYRMDEMDRSPLSAVQIHET